MKTIYLYILTIFIFLTEYCNAQEIIVPIEPLQASAQAILAYPERTVLYFKDTRDNLDKFEGNWLYDDGTHYLSIVIVKHEHISNGYEGYDDNDFEDRLLLEMEYRLNGIEQYSFSNTVGISGNRLESSNIVAMNYAEPSLTSCDRLKSADLTLQHRVSFPNPDQLVWVRDNESLETFSVIKCPDGSDLDTSDFIIPANLTLTKQ